VNAFLDIYATLFRTDLANQMQYRGALGIRMLGNILQPVVYLVVWLTVAKAKGGQVGGFTGGDLAAYYTILLVVNHLTASGMAARLNYRVRSGNLSPLLLQPLHPIHRDLAESIAYKFLTMAAVVPAVVAMMLLFKPVIHPPLWAIMAFVPALLLAALLCFLTEWCVALLAFWITDASALRQIYSVTGIFLTGRMAPLSFMPDWVQTIAEILPFRWMVSFPVELLQGRLKQEEAVLGFVLQSVWLLVGLGMLNLGWHRGLKRYSAVGA
jgi:ABC-2 type transport system permease protein